MEITQEQFNNLATKDDLKNEIGKVREEMATKGDLKSEIEKVREEMATKGDLKKVDDKVNRVVISLIETQEEVKEIKQEMATKKDVDRILAAIDSVIEDNKSIKQEQAMNLSAHDRFEERISRLERARASA